MYLRSTKRQGRVFKRVYKLGELYSKTHLISPVYGLNRLSKNKLYKYIKEHEYNYIITTHLFAAQALTAIKKEYPIHFIAVATDYVCIPFWEETNPDYFIIPSEDLKDDFISKGIKEEKLLAYGIPVALQYREDITKEKAKKELSLQTNKNYVLILTGSMGFGNCLKLLKGLLEEIEDIIFIVSCGNNKKMLQDINNEEGFANRVIALPFTDNLGKYIKASDIVLTKPGGLTTTEVAVSNRPFIHTNPIPGCENYNAEYFEKRNMSIKSDSITDIVNKTRFLLENINIQEVMINNQRKNIKKDASDKIINLVVKDKESI